jgi:hypothetical protein
MKSKLVTTIVLSFLLFSICVVSAQDTQEEEELDPEPEYPDAPTEVPDITPGVIGAIVGVFVAIYVRYKVKEAEYKQKGLLEKGQYLRFNIRRYGTAGLIGLILDLTLQVIIPAMRIGTAFNTGDPVLDFTFAFLGTYGATELVKEGMKRLPFVEAKPQQKLLKEEALS